MDAAPGGGDPGSAVRVVALEAVYLDEGSDVGGSHAAAAILPDSLVAEAEMQGCRSRR
jgi:hypothetical protein